MMVDFLLRSGLEDAHYATIVIFTENIEVSFRQHTALGTNFILVKQLCIEHGSQTVRKQVAGTFVHPTVFVLHAIDYKAAVCALLLQKSSPLYPFGHIDNQSATFARTIVLRFMKTECCNMGNRATRFTFVDRTV